MATPQKVMRKFAKSYLLLQEQSQTMLANFNEDLADFTALFPHLDAAYAAAWGNAITAAMALPPDTVFIENQKQKSFILSDTMKLAAEKYSYLANFLKTIYRTNPRRVLEHFGMKASRKSRMRQMRQREVMEIAYERANSVDYKANLLAKGYTQPEIDELNTLAQQLNTDNVAQEKSKTDRPEMAQQRVILYNIVWDFMNEVHDASLVVYETNYAKQQHYLLYPENNSSETLLLTIENIVAESATNNEGDLPPISKRAVIDLLSGGAVQFGISQDGTTTGGTPITINVPGTVEFNIGEMHPVANIMLVKNLNAAEVGSYRIRIYG